MRIRPADRRRGSQACTDAQPKVGRGLLFQLLVESEVLVRKLRRAAKIFHVPGIGELLVRSIGQGDTPVVTAVLFIFAVLVVTFNLIADVLYGVLDPRIRYS